MRGADTFTESLFTMRRLEDFVPANHPLRPIRAMVNEALLKMDDLFAGMYEADIKGGKDLTKSIQDLLPGIVEANESSISVLGPEDHREAIASDDPRISGHHAGDIFP